MSHEKAWNVLRRVDREGLLVLLARALHVVPVRQLESIFRDYAHPHEVGDTEPQDKKPLPDAAREFAEAALRGEFYEDSRNGMAKSSKAQLFEAQLDLLFDRCVAEAVSTNPSDVCAAYEMLFGLLREIDKFERDIVFFADEGGIWQFAINWKRILPAYLQCLATTTERSEFQRRAAATIDEFVDTFDQGKVRTLLATTTSQTQ